MTKRRRRGMSTSKAVAVVRAAERAYENAPANVGPGPVMRAIAGVLLLSPLVYVFVSALLRMP